MTDISDPKPFLCLSLDFMLLKDLSNLLLDSLEKMNRYQFVSDDSKVAIFNSRYFD